MPKFPAPRLASVALALLLAACGGPPRRDELRPDPAREARAERFARSGYHAESRYDSETLQDRWSDGRGEIDIALTLPRAQGRYPLVIYLPGLGEAAGAGAIWRDAWAQAGYAVVSMQPARSGPVVWASRDARNAETLRVAREQFGEDALAQRLAAVAYVRGEVARRAAVASGAYGRIDASRVVVAGYDLGAQAAFALAGETAPQRAPAPALNGLAGAIALSPHVTPAAGGFERRYGGIGVATLSITGSEDRDGYGLGDTPSAREAPFRFAAGASTYLLSLDGLTHQALSGNANAKPEQTARDGEQSDRREPRDAAGAPPDGDGGPGGQSGRGSRGPGGGMRGGHERGGRADAAPEGRWHADPTRQRIAIQQVSLAFLDATLRGDSIAREWLERNAPRWLEPIATLQTRR